MHSGGPKQSENADPFSDTGCFKTVQQCVKPGTRLGCHRGRVEEEWAPVHCCVLLAGHACSLTLACELTLHMGPAVSASPRPLAGTIPTRLCWVSHGHHGPQVRPDWLGLCSSSTPPGDPRIPPLLRKQCPPVTSDFSCCSCGPCRFDSDSLTEEWRHGGFLEHTRGPGSQGTEATLLSEGPVSGAPLVLC